MPYEITITLPEAGPHAYTDASIRDVVRDLAEMYDEPIRAARVTDNASGRFSIAEVSDAEDARRQLQVEDDE